MATGIIETDDQLETYFEDGDYPDGQEFANLIASKYSKLEGIGEADTASSFVVPENRLFLALIFVCDSSQSITLGTTISGSQLGSRTGQAGDKVLFFVPQIGTGQTIYVGSTGALEYIKFIL